VRRLALFVGALWPAAYSFLGDLIAADDAIQRKSWSFPSPPFHSSRPISATVEQLTVSP